MKTEWGPSVMKCVHRLYTVVSVACERHRRLSRLHPMPRIETSILPQNRRQFLFSRQATLDGDCSEVLCISIL